MPVQSIPEVMPYLCSQPTHGTGRSPPLWSWTPGPSPSTHLLPASPPLSLRVLLRLLLSSGLPLSHLAPRRQGSLSTQASLCLEGCQPVEERRMGLSTSFFPLIQSSRPPGPQVRKPRQREAAAQRKPHTHIVSMAGQRWGWAPHSGGPSPVLTAALSFSALVPPPLQLPCLPAGA